MGKGLEIASMNVQNSSPSSVGSYWAMYLANFDKWICTKCGAEFLFKRLNPKKHAGPKMRGLDKRYGFMHCWRGCRASKKRQIVRHESAPYAKQPAQDKRLIKRLYGDKAPKGTEVD